MADVRFVVADELKIVPRGQVRKDERVLLVRDTGQSPLTMEPQENSVIESGRKSRRGEGDLIGTLAFGASERVRQRLKSEERLNAATTHHLSCTVLRVVSREPKVRDRAIADLSGGDEINFVGAKRLVWVREPVNPVVVKIQIACDRVENKTGSIAETLGQTRQIRRDHVRKIVGDGKPINRFSLQRAARAGYLCVGEA